MEQRVSASPLVAPGGVPAPRRTFLHSRDQRVMSARTHQGDAPADLKSVILNEHRAELNDALQEAVSLLKNVYRTKFVFGDHLRYVDPSYGGDGAGQFNLMTPPSFDPSYTAPQQQHLPHGGNDSRGGAAVESDPVTKEKLRTAEELIKKLYRRNTHLEVENTYLKGEITRLERFAGLGKTESHNLSIVDGHLPLSHPHFVPSMRRNCRSCPPARTLVRSAVDGYGLAFPRRGGVQEEPSPREDPPAVAALKQRVRQLTESLIAVQHENEKLSKEKVDRISLRDTLLQNYIVERDTNIAAVHSMLQEALGIVANPMRLMRVKQPSTSVNPVVATQNVLKEVSQRLSEQVARLTTELVKNASAALPPTVDDGWGADESQARPANGDAVSPSKSDSSPHKRRQELVRHVKALCDSLPLQKRKELVLLMTELKQLYEALARSNRSLLNVYEQLKVSTSHEAIQRKIEVSMLRDQLRAFGAQGVADGGGADAQLPNPNDPP